MISRVITVEDQSQVGEARRLAASICQVFRFSETQIGHVSIIVTELATNLIKHAGAGELIFRVVDGDGKTTFEVLSIDKGPGIVWLRESMEDGYSTAGTLGTGLGAVRRLSSYFDIYTVHGGGTVVVCQVDKNKNTSERPSGAQRIGSVCLPVPTEDACGDAWTLSSSPDRLLVMLCDGLGHGQFAAEAANEAVSLFNQLTMYNPKTIVEHMHPQLRSTRGCALAIAEIIWSKRQMNFVGVGNISCSLINRDTSRSMVSLNGTVGLEVRRVQEFSYNWDMGEIAILHSDGLSASWHFSDYPGLYYKHPSVIAGVLYRDRRRLRDDCSVVVIREPGGCDDSIFTQCRA